MNKLISTLPPQQHPLVESRLIWMRDNEPELLMELWKEGTLQARILQQVEEANQLYCRMREQGVSKDQALECRLNLIAPAEGMDQDREVMQFSDLLFDRILMDVTT